jgi:hypothetical protein
MIKFIKHTILDRFLQFQGMSANLLVAILYISKGKNTHKNIQGTHARIVCSKHGVNEGLSVYQVRLLS